MSLQAWREVVQTPTFARVDFWITAGSGGLLCLLPDYWFWFLLIALIPRGIRFLNGSAPIRLTTFDWLIFIIIVSAGAGYWAAYDPAIASIKFFLILGAVLLFHAISSQPEGNRVWVSAAFFCLGFGVSVYFLLTHDFIETPRRLELVNKIGRWMMELRPSLGWAPIHSNYAAGLAAITAPFGYHLLSTNRISAGAKILSFVVALGLGVVISTVFMATSRGVVMAIAGAAGVWVLWRILRSSRINLRLTKEALFPSIVMVYLAAVVVMLYLGPASIGGNVVESGAYGSGSRAEVFAQSAYLVGDFPFTGGGLGTFPALYSQYILVIPHYYLPNAHNLFLDVFIEQGIPGGIAFLALYLAALWRAARVVAIGESSGMARFGWVVLMVLVMTFIHGLVDDYLYNGNGTLLSLAPVGVAAMVQPSTFGAERVPTAKGSRLGLLTGIIVAGLILMNAGRIRSAWFANVGAVQMARVDLAGFPTGQWAEADMIPALKTAEPALLSSLEADPSNRTANHRLGLISMLEQDFPAAVDYLNETHSKAPGHRGILKVLGYSLVWLGDEEQAQNLLSVIPEAEGELGVYIWWWQLQGRGDLAERASAMRARLNGETSQP